MLSNVVPILEAKPDDFSLASADELRSKYLVSAEDCKNKMAKLKEKAELYENLALRMAEMIAHIRRNGG